MREVITKEIDSLFAAQEKRVARLNKSFKTSASLAAKVEAQRNFVAANKVLHALRKLRFNLEDELEV